jgi:tRNA threonylcarbamoyladenosine biosynthesis protein TsaE
MFKYKLHSNSPEETDNIGIRLGRQLKKQDVVCLTGVMGVGKTTIIKGIARGAGVKEYVTSPSFKLINEYNGKMPFYHFDLYRLERIIDIQELGFNEYFYGNGISVIEWADKMTTLLPSEKLDISLVDAGDNSRNISISSPRELKLLINA